MSGIVERLKVGFKADVERVEGQPFDYWVYKSRLEYAPNAAKDLVALVSEVNYLGVLDRRELVLRKIARMLMNGWTKQPVMAVLIRQPSIKGGLFDFIVMDEAMQEIRGDAWRTKLKPSL